MNDTNPQASTRKLDVVLKVAKAWRELLELLGKRGCGFDRGNTLGVECRLDAVVHLRLVELFHLVKSAVQQPALRGLQHPVDLGAAERGVSRLCRGALRPIFRFHPQMSLKHQCGALPPNGGAGTKKRVEARISWQSATCG